MEPSTRKVVTRSPTHTVRVIHLPHLQPEPVHGDSNPERFFVQIAALYPHTKSIKHQPFKLRLGEKTYTPDFLLTFLDGTQLVVEVKPAEKMDRYQTLFDEARTKLQQHGLEFFVARDVDMTRDKLAARALQIRRYCKSRFSPAECQSALDAVGTRPNGMTIRELTEIHGIKKEVLLHLIGFKRLCSRKTLDISPQAKLINLDQYIKETSDEAQTHAIQFTEWFNAESRDEDDRTDTTDF